MYSVYVIQSELDGRLYKGLSKRLESRILEHNSGKMKSTKAFRPWKLVYVEEFDNREEARAREKYLKSGAGREFLKASLKAP